MVNPGDEWVDVAYRAAYDSMRYDPKVWHEALKRAMPEVLAAVVPLVRAAPFDLALVPEHSEPEPGTDDLFDLRALASLALPGVDAALLRRAADRIEELEAAAEYAREDIGAAQDMLARAVERADRRAWPKAEW